MPTIATALRRCAAGFLVCVMALAASASQIALGQQSQGLDPDAIARRTGVSAIVFSASDGFLLMYPDRRLTANVRLGIDSPGFLARYLAEQPLAPAINAAGALEISRGLVQQAIGHRQRGDLRAAYYIYRFVLANLLKSQDIAGFDIVSRNVWVLRGDAENNEATRPGSTTGLLDLIATDAAELWGHVSVDPRFGASAIAQDASLRRLRITRRLADLAGVPTGFAAYAQRALAAGRPAAIPVGLLTPALEEIARQPLITLLAAEGRVQADTQAMRALYEAERPQDFQATWALYEALRPRLHEVQNSAELVYTLELARSNFRGLRSQAVAAGGVFGNTISMFTVATYLQAFGRDLVTLAWRRGQWEEALALAEDVQARALTDWLARSHRNDRLVARPGVSGSLGEVRSATVAEMRALAARRQAPILYYLKSVETYLLWVIYPDGQIKSAQINIERGLIANILTIFPYGSDVAPVARSADMVFETQVEYEYPMEKATARPLEVKREWLRKLRQQLIPDDIMASLKPYARLTVIPDGLVNYVPFAALIGDDDAYLIDSFAIQMSPAVTTSLVLEASFASRKALGARAADNVLVLPAQTEAREVDIELRAGSRRVKFGTSLGRVTGNKARCGAVEWAHRRRPPHAVARVSSSAAFRDARVFQRRAADEVVPDP